MRITLGSGANPRRAPFSADLFWKTSKSEKTLVFRISNPPQNRHPERSAEITLFVRVWTKTSHKLALISAIGPAAPRSDPPDPSGSIGRILLQSLWAVEQTPWAGKPTQGQRDRRMPVAPGKMPFHCGRTPHSLRLRKFRNSRARGMTARQLVNSACPEARIYYSTRLRRR